MILDIEKLEQFLITNWNQFINLRELRDFIKSSVIQYVGIDPVCNIQKFSVSRFELENDGFLLWIEVTIEQNKSQINTTMEFSLNKSGIFYLNHI